MKLAIIIGTRPEAIKLAPVILEAKKHPEVETLVIATGQHREMLDQSMLMFGIKADVNLGIMEPEQSLADVTSKALIGLDAILKAQQPDVIIVQGDTTTTFCGALAGFYNQIRVAHVEAGLRTRNKYEPFPEEINRCMTSRIVDFHFSPTTGSRQNLISEGIAGENILVTGNTAIDALLFTLKNIQDHPKSKEDSSHRERRKTLLVTAHRRENAGKKMRIICKSVLALLDLHPEVDVVFPVHLNPIVREVVFSMLADHDRVNLTDPMDYPEFVSAMRDSYLILSDSGGVQEEAPSLGKPVLVLREQTERPEAAEAGTALIVGPNFDRILEEANRLITIPSDYEKMAKIKNPYGDGNASKRIVKHLLTHHQI